MIRLHSKFDNNSYITKCVITLICDTLKYIASLYKYDLHTQLTDPGEIQTCLIEARTRVELGKLLILFNNWYHAYTAGHVCP